MVLKNKAAVSRLAQFEDMKSSTKIESGPPTKIEVLRESTKLKDVSCLSQITNNCRFEDARSILEGERIDDSEEFRDAPEFAPLRCGEDHGDYKEKHEPKDGIDNIFDFIETACCGEQSQETRTKIVAGMGKGFTLSELAECKNFSDFQQDDSQLDDESVVSRSHHSSRIKSSSSEKKESHEKASDPSRRTNRHRRPEEDVELKRNRSSSLSLVSRQERKSRNDIAKSATAFIRKSIKQSASETDLKNPISEAKIAGMATIDAPTASTGASTALVSQTENSSYKKLREACVLSLVGSGSTVSSFDENGGGHSWSLHTRKQKHDDSVEKFRRGMEALINFVYSLSYDFYGNGAAAPVNKAICLLSFTLIVICWPENQEARRRKVQQVKIPRASSPVSLLKAVLKGESNRDHFQDRS